MHWVIVKWFRFSLLCVLVFYLQNKYYKIGQYILFLTCFQNLEAKKKKKNYHIFLNPLSFFEVSLSTLFSVSALKVVSWSVAKGSTRGIYTGNFFKKIYIYIQNIKKYIDGVHWRNSNHCVTCDEKAMCCFLIILIHRANNWWGLTLNWVVNFHEGTSMDITTT